MNKSERCSSGANCQIAKPDEPSGWTRTEFEFATAPLKVPHDNKPITICNCVPAFIPERDVPRSLRASHSVDSESTASARNTKETAQSIAHEKNGTGRLAESFGLQNEAGLPGLNAQKNLARLHAHSSVGGDVCPSCFSLSQSGLAPRNKCQIAASHDTGFKKQGQSVSHLSSASVHRKSKVSTSESVCWHDLPHSLPECASSHHLRW